MASACTKRLRGIATLLALLVVAVAALSGVPAALKADEATRKLKRAVEHFQKANSLYSEKKLDEAIAEYREALLDDAQEPYFHRALAKALEDKGDLQSALEEYRIASQQSPLDSGLRSKLEGLQRKLQPNGASDPGERAPTLAEVFKVGGDVTAPIPTYSPEPPYSDKAHDARYEGTTELLIVVDAQGTVADARVEKALGLGLDEKALETIRTWKFRPALRSGVPVAVQVIVEISFRAFF